MPRNKNCCYKDCKNDSRFSDRDYMEGITFIPFPKPKTKLDKCRRWIKACGRPDFLKVETITGNRYVCSEHFVGGTGPTVEFPDPMVYDPVKYMIDPRDEVNQDTASNLLYEEIVSFTREPISQDTAANPHSQEIVAFPRISASYNGFCGNVKKEPADSLSLSDTYIIPSSNEFEVVTIKTEDTIYADSANSEMSASGYQILTEGSTVQSFENIRDNSNSLMPVSEYQITDGSEIMSFENIRNNSNSLMPVSGYQILSDVSAVNSNSLMSVSGYQVLTEGSVVKTFENISDKGGSNSLIRSTQTSDFKDLRDVYVKFLQFQMKDTKTTLPWGISLKSDFLLVYSIANLPGIGFLTVEINAAFELKTQVNGIILNESHRLSLDKFPDASKNLFEFIHYLNCLDRFTRCGGNPEEEFRGVINSDNDSVVYNSFTNAIHSANCEGLFSDQRRSVRCKNCTATRSKLTKRLKRLNSTKPSEKINFRYMNSKQQLEYLRKVRDEKKDLKRIIRRLRRELNKKSHPERRTIQRDTSTHKLRSKDHLLRLLTRHVELRGQNVTNTLKEWDPALIRWCSYLNSKSTSTYEAFRQVIPLPSTKKLYNYISNFAMKSFFSKDIVREMNEKIDLDGLEEYQKYFSLVIDEIKIEDDLVYSSSTGNVVGYTRLNSNTTRFITLIVRGLATNFKHTIGYFPSLDTGVEELFSITHEAIEILETNGFKVLTVVCDKSKLSQELIKMSANFDKEKGIAYKRINPYARLKEPRDIFYILDSSCLIKAVRNCWLRSGINKTRLLMKNGKHLIWEHLEETFRKNSLSWREICPKLTNEHVTPGPSSSLRVELATQVLSSTVASAMEKLVGKKASETIKFVRYFNQMFDILNTRNVSQGIAKHNPNLKPFRHASDQRLRWLEEDFLGYLKEWKVEVEKIDILPDEKLNSQLSGQTQQGIFTTAHSVVEMTKFLLGKGAPYVLTDKFNQYPLDYRFGKRSRVASYSENCDPPNYAFFTIE